MCKKFESIQFVKILLNGIELNCLILGVMKQNNGLTALAGVHADIWGYFGLIIKTLEFCSFFTIEI